MAKADKNKQTEFPQAGTRDPWGDFREIEIVDLHWEQHLPQSYRNGA